MSDYSLGVPDETGLGADAARAREVALTQHIGVSAETDRAVVPKLRQAYDSLVCGRRRLGAIGAEIENAVAHQRALGLDTPAGARNFSRFLATKAHDITRVLAATAAESQAGAARLRSLASSYQAVGFGPKPQEPPPDPVPFPPEGVGGVPGAWPRPGQGRQDVPSRADEREIPLATGRRLRVVLRQ